MYHYRECGLDNVWLSNGYKVKETNYGEAVTVVDVDGLVAALALNLTEKKGQLTGKEFRFLRLWLCMSQEGIARLMSVQEQSVSLWERTGRVTKQGDTLVRLLVLERLNGDGKIEEIISRINTVERLVNQRIVARATQHKWTAKVRTEKQDALAA